MEELFPSEIARLVLGYLKENKCEKSWNIFLEESSDLQEYCQLYKRGKLYPTNVNGKSLLNILSEYSFLKTGTVNNTSNAEISESAYKEKCKVILDEIITKAVENVLQKYRSHFLYNNHCKNNSSLDSLDSSTLAVHTSEISGDNCIEHVREIEKSGEREENMVEISSHNYESNMDFKLADCNNHSGEQLNLSEVSGIDAIKSHSKNLVEPSNSDFVYLEEIIKIEKEDDICSILENTLEKNACDTNQNTNNAVLANGYSECNNYLQSTENQSNEVVENSSMSELASRNNKENFDKSVESIQRNDCMQLEIIKKVKLEPNSSISCNVNRTADTNSLQNTSIIKTQTDGSKTVETSQTTLCNIENVVGQVDNFGNSTSSSNSQSGYALQPTPFSSQPVAINDISFSSVPTYIMPNYSSNGSFLQNNTQYSFIISTPGTWKEASVGGFPLTLPSIHSSSLGPVLTSIETIGNNSTPSVSAVCVSNALSPILTAGEPVSSKNTPSVSGISANAISSPVMTIDTAGVCGQPLIVSSISEDVSSHSICNASDTAPSKPSGKLKNKQTHSKKACKTKKKKKLSEEKETNNKLQTNVKTKKKCLNNRETNKYYNYLDFSSCSLESGKKTACKNGIPDASDPQLQYELPQPKIATRRRGK